MKNNNEKNTSKDIKENKSSKKRYSRLWIAAVLMLAICVLFFEITKGRGLHGDSRDINNNLNADNSSENLTADKNKSFGDYLADNNTLELSRIARENRSTVNNTDYEAISNKLYAWWFKRNDAHEKSGCQEDFDITAYDAYYIVPVSDKRIYITFDCGYENGFTPDMLDVLKEEGVTAAFFVTQTFIRDNVELTKRMKEEGHLVCNHTVTHPSMPSKSIDEQKNELLTCENYMKDATGYDMDLFFRPPRGEYSERTLQMAKDLGYTTIFWSMAYLDYDVNNQPSASHVVEHFGKYYHPGAIPLIHNVSKANHDALRDVIRLLKKEGYSFGNLYELRTDMMEMK